MRSMVYDMTERVRELWLYYDEELSERITKISELSEVPQEHFVKINPAEFIVKNNYQKIDGYTFRNIRDWIVENKTDDQTFLISPLDAVEETAAQVSYKAGTEINRTIRASKCECVPVPVPLAQDFFIRNHRQSPPLVRSTALSFGLTLKGELVAVMLYDISNGAVRGNNNEYELVRLAISKGTRVHGGASKLQKACEATLQQMGIEEIYSYSNATINSGAVYRSLGFTEKRIDIGQPFAIKPNNELDRLIHLYPNTTAERLAVRGLLKTHVGGNRVWLKKL